MAYYIFTETSTPDEGVRAINKIDAALEVLGYDVHSSGVARGEQGAFVPWRRRHSGLVEHLTSCAASTPGEALLKVFDGARAGEFPGIVVTSTDDDEHTR